MTAHTVDPNGPTDPIGHPDHSADPLLLPRVLPRGLNSLPRDIVLMSQRSRLIEAFAHFVAAKGYVATSIADVIAKAGVSRTTFYQQFKDKEDCYLSCYEKVRRIHIEIFRKELSADRPAKEQLVAGIKAYLEHLASDGVYAMAFFAESRTAGDTVRRLTIQLHAEHRDLLRAWYQAIPSNEHEHFELSLAIFTLMVDGMDAALVRWTRDGFRPPLEEMHMTLCYFVFASLGLHLWARQMLVEPAKAAISPPPSRETF